MTTDQTDVSSPAISWAAIFSLHASELSKSLTRVLGDTALAEDCVQDVWIRLLSANICEVRDPRLFMFKVGHNLARDARRRRTNRGIQLEFADCMPDADAVDLVTPEERVIAREHFASVLRAIGQLTLQRRRVLWMVRIEGLSLRQTAESLGISKKTVERHMTEALRELNGRIAGTCKLNRPGISGGSLA